MSHASRTRRLPALLAGVALTLGLSVAATTSTPAAAYAERATVADHVGDPVVIGDPDDDGELETAPAPGARAVDITSTTFVYRSRALVVRARAGLATNRVSPVVRVRSGGVDRDFSADDRGRVYLDSRGGGTRCRGAAATYSRARAVYRMQIPARCLGSPASLRAGLALQRVGDSDPGSRTVDDALLGDDGGLYYEIALGPRLRRD